MALLSAHRRLVAAQPRRSSCVATLLFVVVGVRSALELPIDAVPDVTNVQVQVITSAPGALARSRSSSTSPCRSSARWPASRRSTEVRSISKYGLSVVTVVFEDGTDIYFARQLVNERMREAEDAVPAQLRHARRWGRSRTGLGEIYQFMVRNERPLADAARGDCSTGTSARSSAPCPASSR